MNDESFPLYLKRRIEEQNSLINKTLKHSNSDTALVLYKKKEKDKNIPCQTEFFQLEKVKKNKKYSSRDKKIKSLLKKDKRRLRDFIVTNPKYITLSGNKRYNENDPKLYLMDSKRDFNDDKYGLIPLPNKSRKKMKTQSEHKQFYDLQRSIVMMRRFQYNHKYGNSSSNMPFAYGDLAKMQKMIKEMKSVVLLQAWARGMKVRKDMRGVWGFFNFMKKVERTLLNLYARQAMYFLGLYAIIRKNLNYGLGSSISKKRLILSMELKEKILMIQTNFRRYHAFMHKYELMVDMNKKEKLNRIFFTKKKVNKVQIHKKLGTIVRAFRKFLFMKKKLKRKICLPQTITKENKSEPNGPVKMITEWFKRHYLFLCNDRNNCNFLPKRNKWDYFTRRIIDDKIYSKVFIKPKRPENPDDIKNIFYYTNVNCYITKKRVADFIYHIRKLQRFVRTKCLVFRPNSIIKQIKRGHSKTKNKTKSNRISHGAIEKNEDENDNDGDDGDDDFISNKRRGNYIDKIYVKGIIKRILDFSKILKNVMKKSSMRKKISYVPSNKYTQDDIRKIITLQKGYKKFHYSNPVNVKKKDVILSSRGCYCSKVRKNDQHHQVKRIQLKVKRLVKSQDAFAQALISNKPISTNGYTDIKRIKVENDKVKKIQLRFKSHRIIKNLKEEQKNYVYKVLPKFNKDSFYTKALVKPNKSLDFIKKIQNLYSKRYNRLSHQALDKNFFVDNEQDGLVKVKTLFSSVQRNRKPNYDSVGYYISKKRIEMCCRSAGSYTYNVPYKKQVCDTCYIDKKRFGQKENVLLIKLQTKLKNHLLNLRKRNDVIKKGFRSFNKQNAEEEKGDEMQSRFANTKMYHASDGSLVGEGGVFALCYVEIRRFKSNIPQILLLQRKMRCFLRSKVREVKVLQNNKSLFSMKGTVSSVCYVSKVIFRDKSYEEYHQKVMSYISPLKKSETTFKYQTEVSYISKVYKRDYIAEVNKISSLFKKHLKRQKEIVSQRSIYSSMIKNNKNLGVGLVNGLVNENNSNASDENNKSMNNVGYISKIRKTNLAYNINKRVSLLQRAIKKYTSKTKEEKDIKKGIISITKKPINDMPTNLSKLRHKNYISSITKLQRKFRSVYHKEKIPKLSSNGYYISKVISRPVLKCMPKNKCNYMTKSMYRSQNFDKIKSIQALYKSHLKTRKNFASHLTSLKISDSSFYIPFTKDPYVIFKPRQCTMTKQIFIRRKDLSFISLLSLFSTKNCQELFFSKLKYNVFPATTYNTSLLSLKRVKNFLKAHPEHNSKVSNFITKTIDVSSKDCNITQKQMKTLQTTNIYTSIEQDFVNFLSAFSAYDKKFTNQKFLYERLKNSKISNTNIFAIVKFLDEEYDNLLQGKYCAKCYQDEGHCKCAKKVSSGEEESESDNVVPDIIEDFSAKCLMEKYDSIRCKDKAIQRRKKIEEEYEDPLTQIINKSGDGSTYNSEQVKSAFYNARAQANLGNKNVVIINNLN